MAQGMEARHSKWPGPLYSPHTQLGLTPPRKKYNGEPYKTLQETSMPCCKQHENEG
jgi:hypothetical protein